MPTKKDTTRKRRKIRIKSKLFGTGKKPRLVVFRSNLHTYGHLIDDEQGKTLFTCSDMKDSGKGTKIEKAKKVGQEIAKKAIEQKIEQIIFDRNGYKYHGRIKALAEGAREGGLKF